VSAFLRQFRRAPGRILASIFALALAVGAVGVLAVPAVASSSLSAAAERDGLGDIVVETMPLDRSQLHEITGLDNVVAAEAQASVPVEWNAEQIRLVGLATDRTMDLVDIAEGRAAEASTEVVSQKGLAQVGDTVEVGGTTFDVVGVGSTLWWSDSSVLFGDLDAVIPLTADRGTDRLTITAVDDGEDALSATVADVEAILAADGDAFTGFPTYFPDGTTPVDADIRQVSQLVGLLGIFAGLVALVLLASTTNTLITERTRETAVMRALGGRQRPLRRRLRRIAIGIALAALVIGLPFGIAVSNLIARMVLQEFVGITPGFAIDIPVIAGSAIAVLVGARLVSARAARRVTTVPLATALRDRDGAPFGATRLQRLSTRVGLGGLVSRMATRTSLRRPGRTAAVVAQIAAAVGAAFLVPTLATSVNDYNTSAHAVWQWESLSTARDQGLPLTAGELDNGPDSEPDSGSSAEAGIWTSGLVADWEMDVYGMRVDSAMIDPAITDGAWLDDDGDAVVSAGFADRTGITVGDTIEVALAAGSAGFVVSGLSDDSSRAIYVERQRLSDELGEPGMANVVWSTDAEPTIDTDTPLAITTLDEIVKEDAAGTNAIVVIFGAIGVLVSGVAALAVLSSMTVSLFERRHEFAALQAFGARKRRLRGLLIRELLPLGVLGVGLGLVLGALGARGIIASFEASNAIDIGVTDATAAVPFIALGTAAVLWLLVTTIVRSAARRPIAVSLRGAA
jgi:putative ABC transport system permease protein